MSMNNLPTAILLVLILSIAAGVITVIHSLDAPRGWRPVLVFQDYLFFLSAYFACVLVYTNDAINSDPIDLMVMAGVFYLILCRLPKWGVLK